MSSQTNTTAGPVTERGWDDTDDHEDVISTRIRREMAIVDAFTHLLTSKGLHLSFRRLPIVLRRADGARAYNWLAWLDVRIARNRAGGARRLQDAADLAEDWMALSPGTRFPR